MSAQKPLVVIGHSHSHVVRDAAAAAGVAMDYMGFWSLPDPFLPGDGPRRLRPEIACRLREPAFCMVGGAVHLDIALIEAERPFDVVLPDHPALPIDGGAEIIPYTALLTIMTRLMAPSLATMGAVRHATEGALFCVQPPPACPDEIIPADDPGFAQYWGEGRRIANVWLRQKIWLMQWAIMAAYCRDTGFTVVPVPGEARDSDGLLRGGFLGTPGHTNLAYGGLVLRQIMAIAARYP